MLAGVCLMVFWPLLARAADWPAYRHDGARSGATAETVRPPLELLWTFEPLHAPRPAWPQPGEEAPRIHSDNAFHATVSEGTVCFASSVTGAVYAVDAATAAVLWTFDAEGPVRFAPALAGGRVFFGSDDGWIYCLDAASGAVIWKHRPGPGADKAIGNGRIVSVWPIRTSVLVDDGTVFCCAGVFPFEGIFVCALDAADGSLLWKNDTVGDRAHELQYGGISPQGYLVASEEILYVPSGRAMPAAFDRRTGRFLFYAAPGAKRGGTWALLDGDRLIAGVDLSGTLEKTAFDARTGSRQGAVYAWFPGRDMVVAGERSYVLNDWGVLAIDRPVYAAAEKQAAEAGAKRKELQARLTDLRKKRDKAPREARAGLDMEIDRVAGSIRGLDDGIRRIRASSYAWGTPRGGLSSLIEAGDVVFAGGDGFVLALDAGTGAELWSAAVDGMACGLAASDGRLLVSSDAGPVYCFGAPGGSPAAVFGPGTDRGSGPAGDLAALYASAAERIIVDSGVHKGFALVVDCGEGRLACELAKRSDLTIVGLEKDPDKRAAARGRLGRAGLLGARVVVEPWDAADLPPYFANLVVSDAMLTSGGMGIAPEQLERVLRPFGGTVMTCGAAEDGALAWNMSVRGRLEGAGSWTGLYGNVQNTACSEDELVKGPFGVLWYGEPGPQRLVDRHGRPSSPVSMDGRMFHQGEEVVMAFDAYNGAFLWKRDIPGAVRVRVDVDGGNLALTEDGLYVAARDRCLRLDPATGETMRTFELPPSPDGAPRRWGYVAVADNVLFGIAAEPLDLEYAAAWTDFVDAEEGGWKEGSEIADSVEDDWERKASDRKTVQNSRARYPEAGEDAYMEFHRAGTLWRPMADFPSWGSERTPRKALTPSLMAGDVLFAFDANTGNRIWSHSGDRIPNISVSLAGGKVFFVESASTALDKDAAAVEKKSLVAKGIYEEGTEARLLEPGDEDIRMVTALDAATGEVVWRKPHDMSGCGGDKMGSAVAEGVLLFFGHFSNHDTGFFLGNELTWRRVTALDAATGNVLWSRPLNYLRRPLIVGDTVIIEPRACDLHTGATRTRPHPISGYPVPWEFLRPGHCCSITSASAHTLFYRSYWAAIYDLTDDKGLSLFGAIRPGCWLNMIAANGLMLMPEASSGCTCSFPLKCSIALVPRPEKPADNWSVFITHGPTLPVKHLAVNLGAPGDMRDGDGKLWLAWPRPKTVSAIGYGDYAMRFELKDTVTEGKGYYRRDHRGAEIADTDRAWLFASGCEGIERLEIPVIDDLPPHRPDGRFTVRVGFCVPPEKAGSRAFDLAIQGARVLESFNPAGEAGGPDRAVVKEFTGITTRDKLVLEFTPRGGGGPLASFVEVVREDMEHFPARTAGRAETGPASAKEILEMADASRLSSGDKYKESILESYHIVFRNGADTALRIRALDGMTALASPRSLGPLKELWESSRSILTEYKPIDPAVLNASVRCGLAIAGKVAGADRARALATLRSATRILPDVADAKLRTAVLEELGYFVTWRILGPVPWSAGQGSINAAYTAGKPVDPAGPNEIEGTVYDWRDYTGTHPKIDLDRILGHVDRVSAYACAEFELDEPRDLLIRVGSDDAFKCWLNGELAGGFNGPRGWRADETVLKVEGRKGTNTLLLQIIDHGGPWAFSARVLDAEGMPVRW